MPAIPHNGCIPKASPIRKQASRQNSDQRLHRILRLLTDNATVVVSGTKMANELGVSHSAAWRMVQQLRAYGVEIEGHPTTGYVLKKMPDLALPEALAPELAGTIFAGKIHHSFRVESTNQQATQAAAEGAPEGNVFLAEEQAAGRGRGGHSWHSEKASGIYCSVVLRPEVTPAEALALSLATGLAAQHAVHEVTGLCADLRWPNDLLLGGKKFGGILTEMNAEPTRVRYVVVGIGINVNQESFPAELAASATSLRLGDPAHRAWPRGKLVAALLQSLDREVRTLLPVSQVIRRFMEASSYARGKKVHVEEQGGYDGVTAGLDARGFLLVQTPQELRTVISGGVRALEEN